MPRRRLPSLVACLAPFAAFAAGEASDPAEPALTLPPLVVSATRAPQDPATLPLAVEVIAADTLRDSPALTLDDTLRRSAAFSLFRRAGSLTANPTAQGVSLRGIGPSGASRALVLLDGVPVNDPFGGWIAWTKLPVSTLDRVEIVRGGGSAAWGGASLGGVIHLLSAPLIDAPPGGRLSATVGEHSARGGEVSATLPSDDARDAFRLDASAYATDGVRLVRDPGRIDVPADLETSRAGFAWARRISEITTLETSVRAWSEERGNGTPYQRNASEERSVSARLAGAPRDSAVSAWSVAAYAQDQDYRSTFSGVNATRTAETPASDQYAVPATAAGAAAQLTFGEADADSATTTLGVDARHVDGQTRERFFFTGGGFARERRAGGVQTSAGLFATHARPLAPDLTLTTGARLDAIRRADGFRRETVRATGVVLRDDAYADRDDLALSPSAGLAWRATDTLTARTAAYSAYRSPTLNELYRPFRVGPVETRANPALDPETLLGGEFGLDYAAPGARGGLRATVFENALSDAIANVSLPAPANTRERRNLDSTRVRGLELGGFWQPVPSLRLDADYLLSDARVRSGGEDAATLDGRRLAQVPRHTVTAGAAWQAAAALEFDLRARWVSSQFEDDLNNPALELDTATRIDFSVRIDLAPRLRLVLAVENLFDAEIETSRTDAGVVGLAPPRLVRAELTYAW